MFFISEAYAQTAAPAAGGPASIFGNLLLPVLLIAFMYFFVFRPQQKKQKETMAMLNALSKGDEVVTQGGVIGRIAKLGDTYVNLEVANGVELQVQRVAVIQVLPKGTYNNK